MSNLLLQPAPLLFIAMSISFGIVLLGCTISDLMHR